LQGEGEFVFDVRRCRINDQRMSQYRKRLLVLIVCAQGTTKLQRILDVFFDEVIRFGEFADRVC
jgi:hypothetical protein